MCPKYEEFSWFLGQCVDLPQGVITPSVGLRQVLAELLSVDVHRIRYMFVPGGLDLRRLLHFTRGAAAGSRARTVGAMVCCFATLLFVSGDLVVDTAIILAVRQALWSRSIATMVLAETLNGLDAVSAGGEFFRGAPIVRTRLFDPLASPSALEVLFYFLKNIRF